VNSAAAPRVAFFSDCFYETNGVALTARQFQSFAARNRLPFFSLHPGGETRTTHEDNLTVHELANSKVSFALDSDLHFDLMAWKHRGAILRSLRQFKPDLVHITGPGHVGIRGAYLAHELHVPLVASWHTNVHEFGARRLEKSLSFLGKSLTGSIGRLAERLSLTATLRFYEIARKLFAPNPDLIQLLRNRTGRPTYYMGRGVDTCMFSPCKRKRSDDVFVMGFVGRLTPEKNVRFLGEVEAALWDTGTRPFRFTVIGQGSEKEWLQANLKHAEFPGVLKGEALAQAYANMDLFVFPSKTDTFGNVVQEALASGVPAVVTAEGGPKYIVRSGESGLVAASDKAFVRCVLDVIRDRDLHQQMRRTGRAQAYDSTWDHVFESVYSAYETKV